MSPELEKFDKEWVELAREICTAIYTNGDIQILKDSLLKNGFLTLEEKSIFIDLSNRIKYQMIYERYGQEGSEGYKAFSALWQQWFAEKGASANRDHNQRNSVDHILFGSTPEPVEFLLHYEHEMAEGHNGD